MEHPRSLSDDVGIPSTEFSDRISCLPPSSLSRHRSSSNEAPRARGARNVRTVASNQSAIALITGINLSPASGRHDRFEIRDRFRDSDGACSATWGWLQVGRPPLPTFPIIGRPQTSLTKAASGEERRARTLDNNDARRIPIPAPVASGAECDTQTWGDNPNL